MTTRVVVWRGAAVACALLALACDRDMSRSLFPPEAAVTSVGGQFAFTNFELGAVPGTVCPGSPGCTNGASEPAIRADNAGTFYAGSELGVGSGTYAWKSTDGGLHYTTLTSPNQLSQAAGGIAAGGGDVDIGVATELNTGGNYNAYVASLSLANVTVSTSADGGATWSRNVLSATIPGDDREWIAADGASKVCVSYHDAVTFNIDVDCSFDAGASFTQVGDAIDVPHAWLIDENSTGNLTIDPASHVIYQVFSGIADAAEAALPASFHAVWVGVSRDGGSTFTDYAVYINANTSVSYGHQFINATVDKAGTVYVVYNDNHNMFYSFSRDHGQTWTGPIQVNQAPSATAIMPWAVACDPGELDIVWYGTSFASTDAPDNFPSTAAWNVYFAQNKQADQAGSSFTQVAATPVIHFGGVCEGGISCTGNRDLFDDFGVTVSPVTGFASITYSDDQPTNSGSSDHTSIATQTGGPRICGKH